MAKLTEQDKKLLIADYHTNKYSQRELAKKYNTSLGTVSNIIKENKKHFNLKVGNKWNIN